MHAEPLADEAGVVLGERVPATPVALPQQLCDGELDALPQSVAKPDTVTVTQLEADWVGDNDAHALNDALLQLHVVALPPGDNV